MAGPVAHILCALVLLQNGYLNVDDPQAYFIGTSFPDIRYLGVIERNQTHTKQICWSDVQQAPTSFKAGMLLHSLVDRVRDKYMKAHKIYNLMPQVPYRTQILKFVEDRLIYDWLPDWSSIAQIFDTIHNEELNFNIAPENIHIWHTILKDYCKEKPSIGHLISAIERIQSTLKINSLPTQILAPFITQLVDYLASSEDIKHIILDFYTHASRYLTSDEYV